MSDLSRLRRLRVGFGSHPVVIVKRTGAVVKIVERKKDDMVIIEYANKNRTVEFLGNLLLPK